jgi:hypothetical protein
VTPRDFLGFFKTRSGRLITFVVLFAAAALVFFTVRQRAEPSMASLPSQTTGITNRTDRPQIVHTVERPMEVYQATRTQARATSGHRSNQRNTDPDYPTHGGLRRAKFTTSPA